MTSPARSEAEATDRGEIEVISTCNSECASWDDMLQHLAAAERASLELFLSGELQDLASARRETLARELPGFAEAFDWPRGNETQPNC
jgi:hypothetical protein